MKFRPTEFLNTPYRVSCYIKLYRKLCSCMRPIMMHSVGLTKLMWRRLELSYTSLSRGEGNARL